MLRIANLLRNRVLHRAMVRSGSSNWDRPDPPPNLVIPQDHEFTDEEITFSFFDRNSTEFFLTQPEVYQGDNFLDYAPMLFKGLGIFFGTIILTGSIVWIQNPIQGIAARHKSEQLEDRYQQSKRVQQSKQLLKWAQKNPMGIDVSQSFASVKGNEKFSQIKLYQPFHDNYSYMQKVNGEIKSYLIRVKQKAEQKVKKRLQQHQGLDHHNSNHHSNTTH